MLRDEPEFRGGLAWKREEEVGLSPYTSGRPEPQRLGALYATFESLPAEESLTPKRG